MLAILVAWPSHGIAQRVRAKPAAAKRLENKQRAEKSQRSLRRPAATRPAATKSSATRSSGRLQGIFKRRAAAKKQRRAERETKREAKQLRREARIIPERKKPIHKKLASPNFFDEVPSKTNAGSSQALTADRWKGADSALDKLREPGPAFYSGDVGRVMAARLVNRSSRNDSDFRYAYGTKAFKNFARADKILNDIPKGQLSASLSVDLLGQVNKTAFAEGGDSLLTRLGKQLRNVLLPGARTQLGQVRNYQNMFFASKGVSAAEITELEKHGSRFVKLPLLRAGWIVYAKPREVRKGLDQLIAQTKAGLSDPSSDPVRLSARFVQKFIALHPFPDGNGRTARLVMDRILAERGILPPILADAGNDVALSEDAYATEILTGIGRTAKLLGVTPGESGAHVGESRVHGAAKFSETIMGAHGHKIAGIASKRAVTVDGLPYALGKDGFVYDVAGRPYLADKKGDLRPLSQMTHYIMMRRIALRTDGADVLQHVTGRTRNAFGKLMAKRSVAKSPAILSDVPAIQSDGKLAVDLTGHDKSALLEILDPTHISNEKNFAPGQGRSQLTSIMSRYQQADLELWYVQQALSAEGDRGSVAKVEKHRDVLFARARAELRKRIKTGDADDDNPLGAGTEYERLQYKYSPLRYADRKQFVDKHGDSEAIVFRGENFARWTGVHIDSVPFRPGLKAAGATRARHLGAGNLYDDLRAVEGDTIGTGVQSYTTDLGLLAQSGGFADKHKALPVQLDAMPKWARAAVGARIKDGETIEVTSNTGLISAVLTRRVVTPKGHLSIRDVDPKQLDELLDASVPKQKLDALRARVTAVREKAERRGPVARLGNFFRGAKRFQVKVDDLISENELTGLNEKLSRTRNLLTIKRTGQQLDVTAHRRAIAFRVKKSAMLPGVDSIGGSFVNEQEVHVVEGVLPNRILESFSQKQLAAKVASQPAAAAKAAADAAAQPIVKPLGSTTGAASSSDGSAPAASEPAAGSQTAGSGPIVKPLPIDDAKIAASAP